MDDLREKIDRLEHRIHFLENNRIDTLYTYIATIKKNQEAQLHLGLFTVGKCQQEHRNIVTLLTVIAIGLVLMQVFRA